MGTTAEKGAYTLETKSLLKQKINNLGGNITSETTFREYVEELQDVYDNAPKTAFQTGTDIAIENGLKGKLDFENDKVGYGQTSQDSTNGDNLVGLQGSSGSINGITYKVENGVVTLNGTATSTTENYNISKIISNGDINFTGSTDSIKWYYEGTLPQGTARGYIGITEYYYNYLNMLDGVTYTHDTTIHNGDNIRIRFEQGITFNNFKMKLMINEGKPIKDWEQYSGGYASPSPNWEQEIKCVAGWNRFYEKENGYISNIDGSISAQTGVSASDYIEIPSDESILYFYGKNLSVSTSMQYANRIAFYDSNKTWIYGENKTNITTPTTYSIPNNAKYVRASIVTASEDLMIVFGGVKKYLPYNTIEEVVRGKNVFEPTLKVEQTDIAQTRCTVELDGDEYSLTATGQDMYFGEVTGAGTSYAQRKGEKIYVKGHSKLSFYLTNTLLYSNYITAYDENNVSLGYSNIASYKGVYNIPSGAEYITIRFGLANATSGTTYKTKVMITFSDTEDTTYEPYVTPKTYQFSLGDRKLFEGDYLWIDKTTGKKYHHHKMGTYTMTGDETINMQNENTRFGFDLSTASTDSTKASSILVLCNRFVGISFNDRNSSSTADNGVYQVCNNSSHSIQFNTGNKFADKEAFKTYCRNNNVDLVYTFATETDEEITGTLAEQLEAWWNGQSIKGTTIIESNGDLPLIIKVRALKGDA